MANAVVNAIIKVIGADSRTYIEGKVDWQGNVPKLQERGGVYGIAIKLATTEAEAFFNKEKDERKKDLSFTNWKPIDDNDGANERYYPLYWGKDINLGFRLFEHMKSSKTSASIQLDKRTNLFGKDIIYGAVLCANNLKNENKLREEYPDIYKTKPISTAKTKKGNKNLPATN